MQFLFNRIAKIAYSYIFVYFVVIFIDIIYLYNNTGSNHTGVF